MAGVGIVGLLASACGGAESDRSAETAAESRAEPSGSTEEPDQQQKKDAESKKKSQSGSDLPLEATGPVAVVDGEAIEAEEFNEIVDRKFGNATRPLPRALAEQMKSKIVSSLVDRVLIRGELESADVEASDEEVEREVERFKERLPNPEAFDRFLQRKGMNEAEFEERVRTDVALKNLLRKRREIDVTEKEARKHYEAHIDRYTEPEKVKARHILIKAEGGGDEEEAEKRASELAEKAREEGADFADLAREHSEGPSAKKGGDLGYFARERMVDEFADKAFSLKIGEISDPVETKFGYHVIKREGHKEADRASFESVKQEIITNLERKELRNAVDALVQNLREESDITEKTENVEVNETKWQDPKGNPLKALNPGELKGKQPEQKIDKEKLEKLKRKLEDRE